MRFAGFTVAVFDATVMGTVAAHVPIPLIRYPSTMATAKKSPSVLVKSSSKPAKKVAARPAAKASGTRASTAPSTPSSLTETMRELENAGTEQARKTYRRHGAVDPMFGVSFATLKAMVKRIGVDHDLALELWDTGNHDARVLAMKIADPARLTAVDLDRWAKENRARICGGYVAMLAAEGPHGKKKLAQWLESKDDEIRAVGWLVCGFEATHDESLADSFFLELLSRIEKSIHSAPNVEREPMNQAVIAIGGRNAALRKAATATAKRIGKVEVDHGDTDCKTPDAAQYIEKTWAHASAKKFASPAAQERAREPMRTRC